MSRNAKWLVAFFGFMIATAAMALTVNGELKKALLEKLSADPTGYQARVYYNTTSNKARIYDGSSWADVGGASASLDQYLIDVGSASNSRTTVNTNLVGDAQVSSVSATATITIASPGVVTITGHGLTTGKKIYFTTTGALPTGLSVSTTYYAIFVDANTFRLATSAANALAGTAINTSGSQSGVHTAFYGGINLASSFVGDKTFTGTTTLSGSTNISGNATLSGATTTISSSTSNFTGTLTLGPTGGNVDHALRGRFTLGGGTASGTSIPAGSTAELSASGGSNITINTGTGNWKGIAPGSGTAVMLFVKVVETGWTGVFMLSNSTIIELADPETKFSTTSATASSTNCYYSASEIRIENNTGTNYNYRVMMFII